MINLQPGQFLLSNADLEDPNFDRVVICITEYNTAGAMGFVINEVYPRRFNELVEFKESKPFALYHGGPMENESLYVLHNNPAIIDNSTKLAENLYLGGDFTQTVQSIDKGKITDASIKLFIGYCGWEAGQLEAEIAEGSWRLINGSSELIFSSDPALLWKTLYHLTDI